MKEEELFARLRTRFVDRMRSNLDQLERVGEAPASLEGREALTRLAHGLAGSGGSFGFAEISLRATALEDALSEGDREKVDEACRDLVVELRRATA